MNPANLRSEEVDDLIDSYKSALRKLEYKALKTQETIAELVIQKRGGPDASMPGVSPASYENPYERSASMDYGMDYGMGSYSQRMQQQRKRVKAYKLSSWDEFLLDTLIAEDRMLLSPELIEIGEKRNRDEKYGMSDTQVKSKVSATIHKLSNKHGAIHKYNIMGRGYAYGLPEWFLPNGDLKTEYHDKL